MNHTVDSQEVSEVVGSTRSRSPETPTLIVVLVTDEAARWASLDEATVFVSSQDPDEGFN